MANNVENKSSNMIRRNMSRWSEFPKELCEAVLSKSSLKGILRFKAVCPSWGAAVDECTKSSSFTCLPETSWLVLPQDLNKDEAIDGSRFYSLEGSFYSSNISMPEESRDAICFGSSHGWLVLLNNQLEFMISSPLLSGIQLPLPPLNTFPDILGITYHKGTAYAYNIVDDHFTVKWKTAEEIKKHLEYIEETKETFETWDITCVKDLRSKMRAKGVLSSRPTCSNKDKIGVMVMYIFGDENNCRYNSLAFCTTSDHKWTKLEERRWYVEIMGYDNEFYVLKENYGVDVWDFSTFSIPIKKMEIKIVASAIPRGVNTRFPKVYMIKEGAGLMLVVDFQTYAQIRFGIYKLDNVVCPLGTSPAWMEVQSIGSNALVLGSNNSIVMSSHDSLRCDEDSIYYAYKRNWMSPSYNLGVFSLRNKSAGKKKVCKLPMDFEPLAYSGS